MPSSLLAMGLPVSNYLSRWVAEAYDGPHRSSNGTVRTIVGYEVPSDQTLPTAASNSTLHLIKLHAAACAPPPDCIPELRRRRPSQVLRRLCQLGRGRDPHRLANFARLPRRGKVANCWRESCVCGSVWRQSAGNDRRSVPGSQRSSLPGHARKDVARRQWPSFNPNVSSQGKPRDCGPSQQSTHGKSHHVECLQSQQYAKQHQ